jgi:pyrimidine-nucleoside phosphorylase
MSEEVGNACLLLGGGRRSKEDVIDLSAGIYLHKKVGESCKSGEEIATLYGNDDKKLAEASERLLSAYSFSKDKVDGRKLIKGIIE